MSEVLEKILGAQAAVDPPRMWMVVAKTRGRWCAAPVTRTIKVVFALPSNEVSYILTFLQKNDKAMVVGEKSREVAEELAAKAAAYLIKEVDGCQCNTEFLIDFVAQPE